MANRPAPPPRLRSGDRRRLDRLSHGADDALALRATIVLLAAEGRARSAVAAQLGVSRPTVHTWCGRYAERGLSGLQDRERTGRPRTVEPHDVVRATLRRPLGPRAPEAWTARTLGAHLGVGRSSVSRSWQRYAVRPDPRGGFEFATEPGLLARGGRLVALHVDDRHRAAVVAADGPVADRLAGHGVVTTVHDPPTGATTTLTTLLTPGGPDLRTALEHGGDAPGTDRPPLTALVEAVQRARSGLLSDARLHLLVETRTTLAEPTVAGWLAGHPDVAAHVATDPATWPGLVAAWVLLGERRPGAAAARGGVPVETLLRRLVDATPAGAGLAWRSSVRESGRPAVPLSRRSSSPSRSTSW